MAHDSRVITPENGATVATLRDAILADGLDPDRLLTLGNLLENAGRPLEALDALVLANRLRRDPVVERRIVRLRQAAITQLDTRLAPATWPHFRLDDAPAQPPGPFEVPASELTPRVLMEGVLHHGHVLVRGLVPPARAARLRTCIERTYDAVEAVFAGTATAETGTWWAPLDSLPDGEGQRLVAWLGQGVLACDSPRTLFDLIETLRELGLDELIAAYLGERPVLSAKKCTLRRADASDERVRHASWHQDGAFLGHGIRTLNLWLALSPCGTDAPGMEMVPQRLEQLLSGGGSESYFEWAVSPETIRRELPGATTWSPQFEAGDVLFFDHLFLHRTAAREGMRKPRYAIESWFFAPSVYADDPATMLVV